MPQRYPPYQTWHKRFQQRVKQGVFKRITKEPVEELNELGKIKRGKGNKIMAIADASGLLISAHGESAWPMK
jgi:hypothetical protein